jgi:hypothetical protein
VAEWDMIRITLGTRAAPIPNSKSLRIVGFIFGAVTAAVVLVAGTLVQAHVDGRLTLNDPSYQAVARSSTGLR